MVVIVIHNEYGSLSGEDVAATLDVQLLSERGHRAHYFSRSSRDVKPTLAAQASAAVTSIYASDARTEFRRCLEEHQPDVVHVHNTFPLISPSVLLEARSRHVPVVMTLHNYRLACPVGTFFSRGEVCERCAGGYLWHCVVRDCAASIPKSVAYATRTFLHRTAKVFERTVDMFITLTAFQRKKLVAFGLPARKVLHVPNFVFPTRLATVGADRDYIAYLGRLSPEKGVSVLVEAARRCPGIPFRIAGEGPQEGHLRRSAPSNCRFVGHLARPRAMEFLSRARAVVLPSLWYEGCPLVALEAMDLGRPLILSRLGGLPELIQDGGGHCFAAGDAEELARRVRGIWETPGLAERLGHRAREVARSRFGPEEHYQGLIRSYGTVTGR